MSKTIQIILLPSKNKKINVGDLVLPNTPNGINGGEIRIAVRSFVKNDAYIVQDIYVVSNEEVKTDEWCFEMHNGISYAVNPTIWIDKEENKWYLRQMNMNCSANDPYVKKIIACTNKSLKLPQPTSEFIKIFVNGYNNGIVLNKLF